MIFQFLLVFYYEIINIINRFSKNLKIGIQIKAFETIAVNPIDVLVISIQMTHLNKSMSPFQHRQ